MVVHQSSNQSVFFQLAFVPCHPLNQLLESVALVLSYARVACSRCGRALSLWQFNDAASNSKGMVLSAHLRCFTLMRFTSALGKSGAQFAPLHM